jgi:hypothetical protein
MVLLFAPLLLLAGMGRMRDEALLWWAGSAGLALAALGAYHHWRTASADGGHPGLVLLALTSLFLFIAQAIAQAWTEDYAAHYRSAWQLAVRIAVCAHTGCAAFHLGLTAGHPQRRTGRLLDR